MENFVLSWNPDVDKEKGEYYVDSREEVISGMVLLYMIIMGLPAISLLRPSFSPRWMMLIPSYFTLFGLDAAMFPDYNSSEVILQSATVLAILSAVLILLSAWIFTRRMRKEL